MQPTLPLPTLSSTPTAIAKNMRGTASRNPIPITSIMRFVLAAYMLSGNTTPQ